MWPTAWCSTGEVTIRWPRALPAQAAPLSARLFASVPPEVKTISRGSAFRRLRDALVRLVERGPGLAPERVRGRRVAELLGEERQHRLERLGAERRRRGVVEVDRHRPGLYAGRRVTPVLRAVRNVLRAALERERDARLGRLAGT